MELDKRSYAGHRSNSSWRHSRARSYSLLWKPIRCFQWGLGEAAVKNTLCGLLPSDAKYIATVHTAAGQDSTCRIDRDLRLPQQSPGNDGELVYAHLDNYHGRNLGTRVVSPRRFGLNFGPGSRWLLFAVMDIVTMGRRLGLTDDIVPKTAHFATYVKSQPWRSVPCLWLKQFPGEAYVFPTELGIHNAATLRSPDESTMTFHEWHFPAGILDLSSLSPGFALRPSLSSARLNR